MKTYEIGNPDAGIVLIQPVDNRDSEDAEKEYSLLKERCGADLLLIAAEVDDWNNDLSPWAAPAVFGKTGFGGGACETLDRLLSLCGDKSKTYILGGYSLSGLFALWAAHRTDVFGGVAAASPSVWFPGFAEFMRENVIQTDTVYLSLGDKEEKTRNPVTATVGDRIREAHALLTERGVNCALEWNEGNHFKDAEKRMAAAFAWVVNTKNKAPDS